MLNLRWTPGALVVLAVLASASLATAAEELPYIDGTSWSASSINEKKAYIMGMGNFLNVEYAYQVKSGKPPSW